MVHSEIVYEKTEWHRVYLFYVFFELALGVFLGILGFANLGRAGEAGEWHLVLSVILLVWAAVLFCIGSRLEIRVTGENLEVTLGLGWKNRTIPLPSMESLKAVGVPFMDRKNRKDAWCCGPMALQISYNDDEVFRLGTSEPEVLASVLKKARLEGTLEEAEDSGSN